MSILILPRNLRNCQDQLRNYFPPPLRHTLGYHAPPPHHPRNLASPYAQHTVSSTAHQMQVQSASFVFAERRQTSRDRGERINAPLLAGGLRFQNGGRLRGSYRRIWPPREGRGRGRPGDGLGPWRRGRGRSRGKAAPLFSTPPPGHGDGRRAGRGLSPGSLPVRSRGGTASPCLLTPL